MISRLLGKSVFNANKVIKDKWPASSGIDILANDVFSICKGVVVYVGVGIDGDHVVNVQIDATQCIRYCNLLSEDVSPNQAVDVGTKIGKANEFVRVEYCSTAENIDAARFIRVGTCSYYLHDPYDIMTNKQEIVTVGMSAYDLAMSGKTYDPKQLIKTEAITPYIATIASHLTKFNCTDLKRMGVIGVMLYGGGLFDSIHTKKSIYRSSTLNSQVKTVEQSKMPYGLVVDVRARSIEEAQAECQQLFYLISKYSPALGVWLKLDLVKPIAINDRIIEVYKKNILKWGLKGKCGFYCNSSQLSKISWNKFQDDFYLWWIAHSDRLEVLETLLTPDFFKH